MERNYVHHGRLAPMMLLCCTPQGDHYPTSLVHHHNNSTPFRAAIDALLNSSIFNHRPIWFPIFVGLTRKKEIQCILSFYFCGGIAGEPFIGLDKTNLNSVVLKTS
jgi:hypothetical protein